MRAVPSGGLRRDRVPEGTRDGAEAGVLRRRTAAGGVYGGGEGVGIWGYSRSTPGAPPIGSRSEWETLRAVVVVPDCQRPRGRDEREEPVPLRPATGATSSLPSDHDRTNASCLHRRPIMKIGSFLTVQISSLVVSFCL